MLTASLLVQLSEACPYVGRKEAFTPSHLPLKEPSSNGLKTRTSVVCAMASSSSSRPSIVSSVSDPFDDGHRIASATSVSFPSGITSQPRMRSTLMPISLAHTNDQEVLKHLEIPKPWREKANPRTKITYGLVYGMIFVGIAISK